MGFKVGTVMLKNRYSDLQFIVLSCLENWCLVICKASVKQRLNPTCIFKNTSVHLPLASLFPHTVCLFHKDQPPYRKIKDYCLRILELKDDHVKALVRAGMACYYLREYEVARFYLQSAKDFSHEPLGRISCQHCELLFKPLRSPF